MAELLVLAGLVSHEAEAWSAIYHGKVKIEQWTIGVADGSLPRWLLRGVTIAIGDRSIQITEDGSRIVGRREVALA